MRMMASLLVLSLVAGCGGSPSGTATGGGGGQPAAGATTGKPANPAKFQRLLYLMAHTQDSVTALQQRYPADRQASPSPSASPAASPAPNATASASPAASPTVAPSPMVSATPLAPTTYRVTQTASGDTTGVQGGTQTQTSSPTVTTTNVNTIIGGDTSSLDTFNQTLSNNNVQVLNLQNVLNNSNLLVSALNGSNVNINAIVAVDVMPDGGLEVFTQ